MAGSFIYLLQIKILPILQMSGNKSLSLAKLEQSILREYKRVSYGQQTPQYDVESIYYSDLPTQLPKELSKEFKRSIVLYNYSYIEMLTFAILQFLFQCQPQHRQAIVQKIKLKICKEDFMFGSNFIKGLLVKGLRSVQNQGEKTGKPIAQILLKNDAMNAFSQFWKEVIEEANEQSCAKHTDIHEGLAYHYIANFLGVNFQLFWKRDNVYEEELVLADPKIIDEHITIVIFDKTLKESIITKVLEESNISEESQRGYVILLQENKYSPTSEPSSSGEVQVLRARAAAVAKKGGQLVNKFHQLYRQMRDQAQ